MNGGGIATAERISFQLCYKYTVSVVSKVDMPPDQGRGGTTKNNVFASNINMF